MKKTTRAHTLLSWKEAAKLPFIILLGGILLIIHVGLRKLKGKPLRRNGLRLNAKECHDLEQASKNHVPVSINGQIVFLQPFTFAKQCMHSTCECCPDQLTIEDVFKNPRLYATRDQQETTWKFYAMSPVAWGLLGSVEDDLEEIQIDGKFLGR